MNYQEKSKYREWAKELRKSLDLKRVSTEIESKIRKLDVYKSSKNVMSYLAKELEISLNDLFRDESKSWYLPVVVKSEPENRLPKAGESENDNKDYIIAAPYIPGSTKLVKNKFDILEPEGEVVQPRFIGVIFVPGLCFDLERNRIGFGAGFYDRFLKLNPHSFKIGVCPKECLIEKLPLDSWDVKLDLIVTD